MLEKTDRKRLQQKLPLQADTDCSHYTSYMPLREQLLQEYLNFATSEGSKREATYFSDTQLFSKKDLKCIFLSSHM